MKILKWGILGASNFASQFMGPAIHAASGAELFALATSHADKAKPFSAFAPGLRLHADYEALLADPEIDVVYIPLPNHLHVEWTLKALEAGKHVLCEKPMTLQAGDFDRLIAARDRSGLQAAEAFMIVHHPQFRRARELVEGGTLGKLRHVDVVFSYFNDDPGNIRNKADVGGGSLPDVGVYAFGSVRYVTGQEPEAVPFARMDFDAGVDTYAHVVADFGGFRLNAMTSTRLAARQGIVFHGDKGVLRMTCPFNANVFDQAELHLETTKGSVMVERFTGVNHYVLQVEAFSRAVREGGGYACPLEFSKGTQAMMDTVFAVGGR